MSQLPAREPARLPIWDPNDERYWDARDLEQELQRTFQICHECRMCVGYCGSFPILFDAIDREIDAGRADGAETAQRPRTFSAVSDHCWQCKLCYIKCPYTADEGARELLDFPRLMAREKAQRARRDGIPLVDRVLGEPQLIGALGAGPPAPLANFVNANRLVRKVAEKVTGISAEFPLPPLARQPLLVAGSQRTSRSTSAGEAGEVVLFPTCYGEYNFPSVPQAAVAGAREERLRGRACPPGSPAAACRTSTAATSTRRGARCSETSTRSCRSVRQGQDRSSCPGPTCGYTMKKEWPLYLGHAEARRGGGEHPRPDGVPRWAAPEEALNRDFQKRLGKVAYHAACHLRAQKIAIPGARVLSLVAGHRGAHRRALLGGRRHLGHEGRVLRRGRALRPKARARDRKRREDGERMVVGDCSLAALRIKKETGRTALHPVEALAEAYGLIPVDGAGGSAMKPVERSEILDLGTYEEVREHFRRRVIEEKRIRRVPLGDNMTVLFENHDTVLFQIQEMLRTERITREDAIPHEIETYNELIPGRTSSRRRCSSSIPMPPSASGCSSRSRGSKTSFYLEVGKTRVEVAGDTRNERTDRTLAVHYVKFLLGEELARAVAEGSASLAVGVDHPQVPGADTARGANARKLAQRPPRLKRKRRAALRPACWQAFSRRRTARSRRKTGTSGEG